MTIPPIVRLSQALYSDVPSPAPARSRRKRSHAFDSGTDTDAATEAAEKARPPALVRLILPRTFAVADRAYRDSAATVGYEKVRKDGASRHACHGGDAAPVVQPQIDTGGAREEHGGSGSDRQPPSSIRLASQGGAVLVVVESVIGFSELCGLLDGSHAALARATGASTGCEEPPLQDSDSVPDSVCNCNRHANDVDTGGICEAVGRLVGWLRIAAARTTVPGEGSSTTTTNTTTTTRRTLERARNARTENEGLALSFGLDLDEGDLLFAAADKQAQGTLYGVSRREGGAEWRAFDLEPREARASGLLGSQASGSGGDIAHSAAGGMLEVRLICHPLVTMVPDIRWCLRLISQAKAFAALLNANAKLSTLGGGYFLTRQVGQAIRLALAQAEVATALGDLQLAGKCRVNVAYNYIWLGQYVEAQRIIDAQVAASRAIHDDELENIATIAGRFLRRSRKANRRLLLQSQHNTDGGVSSGEGPGGNRGGGSKRGAGQEWVRQRIDVKTDEWHRVRALPMYCSSGRATPVGCGGDANRGQQGLT